MFLFCIIMLSVVPRASAQQTVRIDETDTAVDLLPATALRLGEGGTLTVRTFPDNDGLIETIEVLGQGTTSGNWAVFSLTNISSIALDRLVVAPHFRLFGSGLYKPDLGSRRVAAITPNRGPPLTQLVANGADVFAMSLQPEETLTFVAQLHGEALPTFELWQPDEYEDRVNSLTLYRGIVLGIAGLLALFLTILFAVRGTLMFLSTAALAWVVLAYVCVDFGFLYRILPERDGVLALWRAEVEIALAAALLAFLFGYLALNRWDWRIAWLGVGSLAALGAIGFYAFFDASAAAGFARLALAAVAVFGAIVLLVLAFRRFDRAVMLVPSWAMLGAWLYAAALIVTGRLDGEVVQPGLTGALVLIVLLIAFTTVQHALASGGLEPGLISDVERRALAIAGSGDAVFDWDVVRDKALTAPDISQNLGLEDGQFSGPIRSWLPHLHPEDRERFRAMLDVMVEQRKGQMNEAFRFRNVQGTYDSFAIRARPVLGANGEIARMIGTITDVTEQRAAMERLLHDAVNDRLTGLPRRELFLERVETAIALAQAPNSRRPTVMVIDLDRFGRVNDAFGMSGGDTILLTVASRMKRALGPQNALARLSGNEFAALILSEQHASDVVAVANTLRETISAPITHSDSEIVLTATIGIVTWSRADETASDLLNDAELAAFQGKRHGGDRLVPFQVSHRGEGSDRLQLETDLRRALVRREINVYYQPIVRLADLTIAGFEALLRWEHPERGFVSPAEFVPIAERIGLIGELGLFALETAARDMRVWRRTSTGQNMFVSVNVSSRQLVRQDLVDDVSRLLSRTELPPDRLKLELTESVVMDNPEQSGIVLDRLMGLGIGLSLDDFGTGYSSLSYLGRFPFDTVKIDQSFMRRDAEQRETLLKSIVSMAIDLDLMVVAEGVENDEDVALLLDLGCQYGQSFHLGRPAPADEVLRLIRPKRALAK